MADDEESDGIEGSTDEGGEGGRTETTGPDDGGGEPEADTTPIGEGSREDEVDLESLANHVVYVSVTFAAMGVGFGLLVFLVGRFGADVTTTASASVRSGPTFTEGLIATGLTIALFVPLVLSPLTGLVVNFSIEEDRTALVAATFGTILGSVLFFMLAGLLSGFQAPMISGRRLAFAPLWGLVDSLLVGIISGGVAGVSAVLGQRLD